MAHGHASNDFLTQTKSLQFAEKSSEALALAEQLAAEVEQEKQSAAPMIPVLAERLCSEQHLIQLHEKHAAEKQLGDHPGTLKILGNVLTAYGQLKLAYEQKLAVNPGRPVSHGESATKSGSAGKPSVVNPNYVGRRTGAGEKSASDIILATRLGISDQLNWS